MTSLYTLTHKILVHDEDLLLTVSRKLQTDGSYDNLTAEEFESDGDETIEGAIMIVMSSEIPPLDAGFEIEDVSVDYDGKV